MTVNLLLLLQTVVLSVASVGNLTLAFQSIGRHYTDFAVPFKVHVAFSVNGMN